MSEVVVKASEAGVESRLLEMSELPRKNSYHPQLLHMPPVHNIDIAFENIAYSVAVSLFSRERKQVLKGVSGCFKSGELTAIMGPSGAGKSSLLNVLSGFINTGVTGNIFANNLIEDANRRQIKSNSAYILQDDHLSPLFTVNEIMKQAADTKLGRSINYKSKMLLIENILESMSLSHTKNTRCNRLSGGEMKRLNVSLELINNPPILFLDEPTSGLDSSSSALLVSELKGLAEGGRTVICTIHQPSAAIISMFDHLYLLGAGKNVYQGDISNMLKFLEYIGLPCPIFHNPADFMMDVVSGEFGNHTNKFIAAMRNNNWRSETEYNKSKDPKKKLNSSKTEIIAKRAAPSEFERLFYLVPKLTKELHRDWKVTYLKVILNAFMAGIVGWLFIDSGANGAKVFSNMGFIFASCGYISFTSLMPAALRFEKEIKVMKKEHFNNWYKFKTHFLAFLCVHIPFQMLLSTIYLTISYIISGQLFEMQRFLMYLAVGYNIAIQSMLVGLLMGTFGATNGVFNGSIYIVIMALHGGFFASLKDFPYPLYLFSFISYFRYSFEIILISVYGMNRGKLDCPDAVLYCHLRYSEHIFVEMGFEEENLMRDVIIQTCFILVIGLVTFLRVRHALKSYN